MSKYHKKVLRKQGKCIFGNEKPISFRLTSAHFAHTTSLHYVGNVC